MKFGEEGLAGFESLPEPHFELLFKMSLRWGKTSGEERSNVLTRAAEILADVSVTFMGHGSVPCCLGAAQRPCRCHQRQRTVPQEKHPRQGG